MIRRAAALLLALSLLVGGAISCGKLGPPERPGRDAPEQSP